MPEKVLTQHRALRCRACGAEYEREIHTPQSLMQQGTSVGEALFGKGLLGAILGFGGGVANVAVRSSTGVGWNARCACGSDDVELIPETYTRIDWKHVERLVLKALRRAYRDGPRAIEEAWAWSYEQAHVPRDEHRMPFVEPRGETLATHAQVAKMLYEKISPERRSAMAARPHLDWIGIVRARQVYFKMPTKIRPGIREECRKVERGEIPFESKWFAREFLSTRESVAVLVEDLEALGEE